MEKLHNWFKQTNFKLKINYKKLQKITKNIDKNYFKSSKNVFLI